MGEVASILIQMNTDIHLVSQRTGLQQELVQEESWNVPQRSIKGKDRYKVKYRPFSMLPLLEEVFGVTLPLVSDILLTFPVSK